MRAMVKKIVAQDPAIDLEKYFPDDECSFGLFLNLYIGSQVDAADVFSLYVCSPNWIDILYNHKNIAWGRHTLIMQKYDLDIIKQTVADEVSKYYSRL